MGLILQKPQLEHETAWRDILTEIQRAGELVVPYALCLGLDDYLEWLRKTQWLSKGKELGEWVRADLFFLVEEEKPGYIFGAINLRYELNDYLRMVGGHIGYGVRPSQRGKGYATRMLALALPICKAEGLQEVLITCETWNAASEVVIQHNGGVLDNVVQDGEKEFARYWIAL